MYHVRGVLVFEKGDEYKCLNMMYDDQEIIDEIMELFDQHPKMRELFIDALNKSVSETISREKIIPGLLDYLRHKWPKVKIILFEYEALDDFYNCFQILDSIEEMKKRIKLSFDNVSLIFIPGCDNEFDRRLAKMLSVSEGKLSAQKYVEFDILPTNIAAMFEFIDDVFRYL